MKIEIWPDDVSMPEMTDWLAELRDDGRGEPTGEGQVEGAKVGDSGPEAPIPAQASRPGPPVSVGDAVPPATPPRPPTPPRPAPPPASAPAQASAPGEAGPHREPAPPPRPGQREAVGGGWPGVGQAETSAPAHASAPAEASAPAQADAPAEASAPAETDAPAETSAPARITARAVIGDELRMPITWGEGVSCISLHADPAALGEADNRSRAIDAGWRVDALGRLTCPRCQQTASSFRVSCPVVLWDRHTAITRATRMAGARANAAAVGHGRDPRHPAGGHPAASPPEPERHREHPAAKTTRVGRHAR